VWVLQFGRDENLAIETFDVHPGDEIGRQHLDNDFSPERIFFGDEHARHAATAELSLEGVRGT